MTTGSASMSEAHLVVLNECKRQLGVGELKDYAYCEMLLLKFWSQAMD